MSATNPATPDRKPRTISQNIEVRTMKRFLPTGLLLPVLWLTATPMAVTAQTPAGSPAVAAAPTAVAITSDVVYGHKAGMALTFDVFQPTSEANGVGLLHMVSGGWVSSWTDPEVAVQRYQFLLDEGYTVFSIRHGSSPRFMVPEAFDDVKLATRYINLHAENFGVDPERLGVWGSSAGGHLSLLLGLTEDEGQPGAVGSVAAAPSRIAAVAVYFPPTDLRTWVGPSERFPALNFERELAESVSPILHVTPEAPPVLLMHGDADTLVPISHSVRIFDVLQEEGVTSEFITFPGAGHGFQGEDQARSRAAMIDWFGQHLLGGAAVDW